VRYPCPSSYLPQKAIVATQCGKVAVRFGLSRDLDDCPPKCKPLSYILPSTYALSVSPKFSSKGTMAVKMVVFGMSFLTKRYSAQGQ